MASPAVIVGEERYVFETDFYDTQADILRYYRITFYPGDSTIEMVSIRDAEKAQSCWHSPNVLCAYRSIRRA